MASQQDNQGQGANLKVEAPEANVKAIVETATKNVDTTSEAKSAAESLVENVQGETQELKEEVYGSFLSKLIAIPGIGVIVKFFADMFSVADDLFDLDDEFREWYDDEDYDYQDDESNIGYEGELSKGYAMDVDSFTPGQLRRNVEASGAKHIDFVRLIKEREIELKKPKDQRDRSKLYIPARFLNIPMVGEGDNARVNEAAARTILEGTPLTWDNLKRINKATAFSWAKGYRLKYLPCALTIASVLKERGFSGKSFLDFWKLGMAIAQKESACGFATYGFYDGATGVTQFTRGTRERMFFDLPERERQQYTELHKASLVAQPMVRNKGAYIYKKKEKRLVQTGKYLNNDYLQYNNLLTNYMLHSPTLAVRMMVTYLGDISAKVVRAGIPFGTAEHAKFCHVAYNIGSGRLKAAIKFWKKFPNPKANRQAATAYLIELGITHKGIQKRLIDKIGTKQNKKGQTVHVGFSIIENSYRELTNIVG